MGDKSSTTSPWWEQLDSAVAATNYRLLAQLGTTRGPSSDRLEGRPACRTVHILRVSDRQLYFGSDTRSDKVDDVKHGNSGFAELCWYFADVDVQFRFSGVLFVHSGDSVCNEIWGELSSEQRKLWSNPCPGAVSKGDVESAASQAQPEYFCVCRLSPDYVDLSYFGKEPFKREIHELATKEENRWETTQGYA